jgi:hypothetical protein
LGGEQGPRFHRGHRQEATLIGPPIPVLYSGDTAKLK